MVKDKDLTTMEREGLPAGLGKGSQNHDSRNGHVFRVQEEIRNSRTRGDVCPTRSRTLSEIMRIVSQLVCSSNSANGGKCPGPTLSAVCQFQWVWTSLRALEIRFRMRVARKKKFSHTS